MDIYFLIGAVVSLCAWLYLAFGRGYFWQVQPQLSFVFPDNSENRDWPSLAVVIPARNERKTLVHTLPTLLEQNYNGSFHIFLVDDRSTDGTGEKAYHIGENLRKSDRLTLISAKTLPPGWTGKLWALNQGVEAAQEHMRPEFFLFTDADIVHPPLSLKALVSKAMTESRDMVSVMVMLKVTSTWERLLIPSFVYFFSKLYPFKWVNKADKKAAAAAGGCILVRAETLFRSGGLKPLASALIDDCALARQIKGAGKRRGNIWLGLSHKFQSIRCYEGLKGVWDMVRRTAFTELKYSYFMLLFTVTAMSILYLLPPFVVMAFIFRLLMTYEIAHSSWVSLLSATTGGVTWAIMASTFVPMIKFYKTSPFIALLLPLSGLLYTLMTIDSAFKHIRGKGGQWKGRTYGKEIT
jgi:hopene-associated glycosyltransferase HpnB